MLKIRVLNAFVAFSILFVFPLSMASGRQILFTSEIDKIVFVLDRGTGKACRVFNSVEH